MRKALVPVVVLVTAAASLVVSIADAEAHTDACLGNGTLVTAAPLLYPPTPATTPFSATFVTGTCVASGPLGMSGVISGSCGVANGVGTTGSGHSFSFAWMGATITFVGDVQGTMQIGPDVFQGESCLTGADRFLLGGAVTLVHALLPSGGPSGPSTECTTGNVTDGTVTGIETRLKIQTVGTDLWVCVRLGSYGGKLVVSPSTGLPPAPTSDANAGACEAADPDSVVVEQEVGPTESPLLLAVHRPPGETWLCLQVDSLAVRVIVSTSASGSAVSFRGDSGTPNI
jgi:hypothetical protein